MAYLILAQTLNLTEDQEQRLCRATADHAKYTGLGSQGKSHHLDSPFLRALGDGLDFPPFLDTCSGSPGIGVVFFESAQVPKANLEKVRHLDAIITGSSWNAEVLQKVDLTNVFNCPQGIDPSLFRPGKKSKRFGDRFTVFSGGKLEYRKGQDLVVAAFKRFHQAHPDTLLVAAWHNPWPEAANSLSTSPHICASPPLNASGGLDIAGWLIAEGLPENSFFDLGPLANAEMPPLLWDMDLAVFPNRCEGGTNLVAMEAMACGVPCILSRNTGHLDIFGDDTCYGLDLQIPLGEVTGQSDLEGWGESSIEECVQKMEQAYADRERLKTISDNGASFMPG